MRLLILGGTQFLGRAVAAHAYAMGFDVTCAARGVTGTVPHGARFIHVDRDKPNGLAPLAGKEFDAVVDVSRHPGQVRRAVAAFKQRIGHWTFISTVSVYADNRTTGQRADAAPLQAPTAPEIEHSTDETYGAAKVACEQAVGENAFICRAGLIVGPKDPTGRFTYWPTRLDRGGEVLVPGTPDDAVQFIDVRDLAQWIVHAAQTGLTGCFDGIGPSFTRGRFLAECADALGSSCTFTWVDRAFLESQDIRRWSGARSLPLWLPLPDYAGFATRDTSPARKSGLTVRALSQTARDTLSWARTSGGPVTGLTADEETAALKAWHASLPQSGIRSDDADAMGRLKFKDVVICREERFSIGIEESSGRFYLAIPVSNGLVDYEEYYEIDRETFARYQANPKAALGFVERCRSRDADEHLIYQPGKKRGSAL